MSEGPSSARLLTVPEVALQLGVTEETVRRWLRAGDLPGVRLARKAGWRIRAPDLEAFLQARDTRQPPT
ncbi:MAG: helix-turn-helix domain-containing protein [Ktedonobacterales bacterium]|nr:helix-turn-helix domain-containing protein [Ktedonobacterales bacterium]